MGKPLAFEEQVDEWVRAALPRAQTFEQLVENLPGTYPLEIAKAAARVGGQLAGGASQPLLHLEGPTPHPIDGDWRLHPETHELFLRMIRENHATDVALLGCPSLVVPLAKSVRRLALVDRNEAWAQYLSGLPVEVSWGDVSQAIEQLSPGFQLAIADPPWYPRDFASFLASAANLVNDGGLVLLSWPDKGTRPGLAEEWSALVSAARETGLAFQYKIPRALRYCTPFFEANSLHAAAIPVLNAWRRSDLVVFARTAVKPRGPTVAIPQINEEWRVVRWGDLDLRVLSDAAGSLVDPRLLSLVEGDVLGTVSRRDPIRSKARVWTGGNRVFGCRSPDALRWIALAHEQGHSASVTVEGWLNRSLTRQEGQYLVDAEDKLRALEEQERREYVSFYGESTSSSATRGRGPDPTVL